MSASSFQMTCPTCEALMAENAALMERYQIVEAGRYAAERQVKHLKAQLHGSTSPETTRVKDVCDYHDELWHKAYPKARGLSYPMDGKNAAAVRKVLRWGFNVEQIKHVLDKAFASEFHRSKPQYLYLASVLGDENKIRNHLTRGEEEPRNVTLRRKVQDSWKSSLQDPVTRILDALSSRDCSWRPSFSGDSWSAQCPAHADRSPSLSVSWRSGYDEDQLLVHCFAGCETVDVMAALGLELADLWGRRAAA